jgi:hypothetical protein
MAEKTCFIVRGIKKIQERDASGRFLPRSKKYVIKSCPKVLFTRDLNKSKLFNSYSKANYVLHGISKKSESAYDFEIVQVQVRIEENEER